MSRYCELNEIRDRLNSMWQALNGYTDPLRKAAARTMFDTEMHDRFEQVKQRAREAGYKTLYIGEHPGWTKAWDNMVFAEPDIDTGKTFNSIPLWNGVLDPLGGMGCGNGGRGDFVQAQLSIDSRLMARFHGRHEL